MIKHCLTFLFIIISFSIHAQKFSMDVFHKGKIILVDGDTLTGQIRYDFPKDVVHYHKEGGKDIFIFSAQQIISFNIYDQLSNNFRQFYSLPYDLKRNNYKVPVLFEVLEAGPLTLLVREKIEYKNYSYGPRDTYSRLVTVYDFFYLKEPHGIYSFNGKKKDFQPIVKNHFPEVNKYIKSNRIKLDRRSDMANVTRFYNQLIQKN